MARDRIINIIASGWSRGAPNPGCAGGPDALRAAGLQQLLERGRPGILWEAGPTADPQLDPIASIASACAELADHVERTVTRGELAIVLGGDHSCAVGTWQGVARAVRESGPIGLLWIDAHLDSHVPETSPTGNVHGMPLASLLGYGPASLTGGTATLLPEHVCVVGARSFEPAEAELLMRIGVRVFGANEIERRGLGAVMADALSLVRTAPGGFGISIDVDAIDPIDAPGVGVPVAGGLRAAELAATLRGIGADRALRAIELAEFDPELDPTGQTCSHIVELLDTAIASVDNADRLRALEARFGAKNYDPLPVVLSRGRGVFVWDTEGRRYLDMMSAYSAVSLGHAHPRIVAALTSQAGRLAVTSRAYHNDRLPLFLERLCTLTGYEQALPVNTGLEAVETALKAARKWGYRVKGIPEPEAEIIACDGNFHGRSIAIVGLSSEPQYRSGFGPFPSGLVRIPFGDAAALQAAITPRTAAFLVEPIQGEAGIVIPPAGYLAECARICRERGVLLICDEVQTGLGRTGRFLACEHERVRPDGVILGKALGGGMLPVSAFLADRAVMGVFAPGDHGSTFGGNPLAAAVAMEALDVIVDERLVERSEVLGAYLLEQLREIDSPVIREVRGRGLFVGMEIDPSAGNARTLCKELMAQGILTKDTHDTVLRFAPPLVIDRDRIDWAVERIRRVLARGRITQRA